MFVTHTFFSLTFTAFEGQSVTVEGAYTGLPEAWAKVEEKASKDAANRVEIYERGPKETKKPDEFKTIIIVG